MGSKVVISFEGNGARVVYASARSGAVMVHDALVLKEEEIDGFLEKEKAREFVVVNNFKETFQETFRIPYTSSKYRKKIIELEIRKRCAFDSFSYLYLLSGEKFVESKKVTEVFVFAVRSAEIGAILARFSRLGKTVKALYPDIFLLSAMIDSADKAVLCVTESGPNKTLFIIKDGKIAFVRQAQSGAPGISDFDVQNIDMTLNYSRQSLRLNPSLIMLTGSLCNSYNAQARPSVPLACLVPPQKVRAAGTVVTVALEFLFPISALDAEPYMDLSPETYKGMRLKKRLLGYSAASFAALCVVTLIFAGTVASDALKARKSLRALYSGLPDIEAATVAYDSEKAALDEYAPLIDSLNKAPSVKMRALLLAVSRLSTQGMTLELVSASPAEDGLRCRIEGVINARDYSGAQALYDRMIASVDGAGGLTLSSHALTLSDMRFFVEADYR